MPQTETPTAFVQFIRSHRTTRNWSQSELSRRSGLTQAEVSRLENGQRTPTLRHVQLIARAFAEAPRDGDSSEYAQWVAQLVDAGELTRQEVRANRRSA